MKKLDSKKFNAHLPPLLLIAISVIISDKLIDLMNFVMAKTLSPDGMVKEATTVHAYIGIILTAILLYYIFFVELQKNAKFYFSITLVYLLLSEFILAVDRRPIQSDYHIVGYFTAGFLILSGIACFYNLARTKKTVWVFMGGGFIFVAMDELVSIHERLGTLIVEPLFEKANLVSVMNILDHPDDWIILMYLIVGLIFVYVYWTDLIRLEHNTTLRNFILLGLFFQSLGVLSEAKLFWVVEEVSELWAALSYLIASSSVYLLRKFEFWRRIR